jgi:hypothetical protein
MSSVGAAIRGSRRQRTARDPDRPMSRGALRIRSQRAPCPRSSHAPGAQNFFAATDSPEPNTREARAHAQHARGPSVFSILCGPVPSDRSSELGAQFARCQTMEVPPSLHDWDDRQTPKSMSTTRWVPCIALTGRESVGRALCVTNLRDNATSWGMYVAQLGDRRQDRTIR